MRRRRKPEEIPPASRFDKFNDQDLINAIDAAGMRCGELFRGLSHAELDREWVLDEMRLQMETALGAIKTLQRRVALSQSI